ncbi:MAG TPA: hypothetical protein VI357_24440 [Mycobacteriales bacterium]
MGLVRAGRARDQDSGLGQQQLVADKAVKLAVDDPAVRGGLIALDIRPW